MLQTRDSSIKEWRQVIDKVLKCLKSMNLADITIKKHQLVYKKFLRFLDKKKKFTTRLPQNEIDSFLRQCGMPALSASQKRSHWQKWYRKALRILLEFHQNGMFNQFPKHRHIPRILPAYFETTLTEYSQYRIDETGITAIRNVLQYLREFLGFLCDRKIRHFEKIKFDDIQAYFKISLHLARGTMMLKSRNLRGFFKYLIYKDLVSPKILDSIPRIRFSRRLRLNAIWPKKSVEKLLSVIDRKTSLGKRDYAMCLLVARLGLRMCDIRTMQLENIDWRKAVICLSQQKTGNMQELPFSEEIGIALIDYLKNGRPASVNRHVFLTHVAPYRPFVINGTHQIIDKYRNKAKVILPKECSQGFHSLRHSLATRLHEAETPLPVIATILGHSTINSARVYAKSNIEMLREAALGWKEAKR